MASGIDHTRLSDTVAHALAVVLAVVPLAACGEGDRGSGDARGETLTTGPPPAEGIPPSWAAGDAWDTYGGDPGQRRHSSLREIHRGNVADLRLAWSRPTGVRGVHESTPIVADGAMYVTTPLSEGVQRVLRLDPTDGSIAWVARLEVSREARPHPTATNRGVAVADGRVYVATLDARLVALDAASGEILWERRTADPAAGYGHKQAPLAAGGRVYLGVSGGPLGIRGFVKAFDGESGRELWTWHTIPSPEEGGWWGEWRETLPGTSIRLPRDIAAERTDSARYVESWRSGGGAPWMTPTLDRERGLLFVGVGNPAPELTPTTRPGDNRWTCSVCALRAEDGSLAWCYQYLPHDLWGMDAASPPFLLEVRAAGEDRPIAAVGHFSKLGLFYAWGRESGRLLTLSENYVPHENFLAAPTREGTRMAPGIYGGTDWAPAAYSPRTGLAYATAIHAPGRYVVRASGRVGFELGPVGERRGAVVAVEPASGRVAWEAATDRPLVGGLVSTGGGLVFSGTLSGRLVAWDAESGELLWSGEVGVPCASAPITYRAGGRQHVALTCGGHFLAGGGREGRVVAFALPGP